MTSFSFDRYPLGRRAHRGDLFEEVIAMKPWVSLDGGHASWNVVGNTLYDAWPNNLNRDRYIGVRLSPDPRQNVR